MSAFRVAAVKSSDTGAPAAAAVIVVGSDVELVVFPSWETVTVLTTVLGASGATVRVRSGKRAQGYRTSIPVHGPEGCTEVQPCPAIEAGVSVRGTESVTDTIPVVGPVPAVMTEMVLEACVSPGKNPPAWDWVMVRSAPLPKRPMLNASRRQR